MQLLLMDILLNFSSKTEVYNAGLFFPAGDTAFKTLLSARFCAAIWSHITDCDETFNYWEPMHFLGKFIFVMDYQQQHTKLCLTKSLQKIINVLCFISIYD